MMPPPDTSNPSTMTKRPGGRDVGMDVEGDRLSGVDGQLGDFVAADKDLILACGRRFPAWKRR